MIMVVSAERRAALRRGFEVFGARVHAVRPDQWTAPTPCADWDVRALVNHVVVEQLWVPALLGGETVAGVGNRFDGDLLGDDPVGRWEGAAETARSAWDAAGAWDRTVVVSRGPTPALVYASELTADLLIHGWDLARAVGAAEPVEPELVRLVLDDVEPWADAARAVGVFGPAVRVPPGSDDLTRLLGVTGRDRNWKRLP
jgi:uncharacterized protein (TIGR03086 family)